MVAQRHEGIWMSNAYQHSPVLTAVTEATKRSMTQHEDALEDTFWQSASAFDGLIDDELTDEAEEDTFEDMARVPSQDFRFYHEGQRLKEETLKEMQERIAAMSPPTSPGVGQQYTYLSFTPHDSDDDNSKHTSGSCTSIVILSDCKASLSDGKTNSSQSTVPTRPPPEDGSPTRKSRGSFGSTRWSQSRSRKTTSRKTPYRPNRKTTLCHSGSQESRGTSNKSKTSRRSQKSGPSIPKLQRAFSSQTGQTTISSVQSGIKHHCSSTLPETQEHSNHQLTRIMPRNRNSGRIPSAEDESPQANVLGKWQRRCETLWAPIFFELWEEFETKEGDDDATLTTCDEELSYEDEGNVDVLVAIQVSGEIMVVLVL
jgi:hypothetical protein